MDRDCHNVYTLGPVDGENRKLRLNSRERERRSELGHCLPGRSLPADLHDSLVS